MPIHDWSLVDAGTFHHFHTTWITHLSDRLNAELLPSGYYAMAEQHFGRMIADVLTLHRDGESEDSPSGGGTVVFKESPPRVSRKATLSAKAAYRAAQRTLAIRHVSNHRVVALLEIISPANKDRAKSVETFVDKAQDALKFGVSLLLIDLFPPGPHDPDGMAFAIWPDADPRDDWIPTATKPLELAALVAGIIAEGYMECIAVGDSLPPMPLFLDEDRYVNVPLDETYQAAFRGLPEVWRRVLLSDREGPPRL